MSYYLQLLGSDTPNGYGGCCYYGPLDHPVFQESSTVPSSLATQSGAFPYLQRAVLSPYTTTETTAAASAPSVDASGRPSSTHNTALPSQAPLSHDGAAPSTHALQTEKHTTSFSSSSPSASLPAVQEESTEAHVAWNWSSYLNAPQPTWPTSGPLHCVSAPPDSPLSTPPITCSSSSNSRSGRGGAHATDANAAALAVSADTGSSGNEGYIFFNCPEGTQRFSSEANIKLKKVRCFCFTRWNSTGAQDTALPCTASVEDKDGVQRRRGPQVAADAVGAASAAMGLPGMLFTINDAGSRQATFFGPSAAVDTPHSCSDATGSHGRPSCVRSASACAVAPSTGLRGFLSALRFHYFQYRPMVFRQLHGVIRYGQVGSHEHSANVRGVKDYGIHDGNHGIEDASAADTSRGNEVHYTEAVQPASSREVPASAAIVKASEPFFYATIPLSTHSILVAFRVSGGQASASGPSLRDGTAMDAADTADGYEVHSTRGACFSATHEASPCTAPSSSACALVTAPPSAQCVTETGSDDKANEEPASLPPGTSGSSPTTTTPTTTYTAPDSSHVVLGYAIVVAPGSSFDAAKARALGVRSGPKYGLLKQGIAVEADPAGDATTGAPAKGKKGKAAKEKKSTDGGVTEGPSSSSSPLPLPSDSSVLCRDATDTAGAAEGAANATAAAVDAVESGGDGGSSRTARWIHPHEVMRPTPATRHTYVSLVLDSDAAVDVRHALSLLLGRRSDAADSRGSAASLSLTPDEEHEGEGGALLRLLRERFPHMAYYTTTAAEEDEEEDGGAGNHACGEMREAKEACGTGESGTEADSTKRQVRRPRQLTVRHVAHLQPLSYFDEFARSTACATADGERDGCEEGDAPQAFPAHDNGGSTREAGNRSGDRTRQSNFSACRMPATASDSSQHWQQMYVAYNRFIFADVAVRASSSGSSSSRGCVNSKESTDALMKNDARVTLSPTLSFTLDDMADVEDKHTVETDPSLTGNTNSGVASTETPPHHTWHLYTSFIQRHFTAFPTALVHRYHLHHLAPTLFPLRGRSARQPHSLEAASDRLPSATADAAAVGTAVEYWPYSLKLRCVPEVALQFPSRPQGRITAASNPPSTSTAPPPRKREKKDSAEQGNTLETQREGNGNESRISSTGAVVAAGAVGRTAVDGTAPAVAAAGGVARPPPAPVTRAKPRRLAVVDGMTSLLPYPTPATALALLSSQFLKSLPRTREGRSTSEIARDNTSERQSSAVSADTVPLKTEHASSASPATVRAAAAVADTAAGLGGGALGFLGTGSAVPSKYRNVSGTYLELYLPAYCFGSPVARAVDDEERNHDSREEVDGRLEQQTKVAKATEKAAREAESSRAVSGTEAEGAASTVTLPAATSTASHRDGGDGDSALRRGVIILDFGEGSLGQLASLCEGVRGGVQAAAFRGDSSSECLAQRHSSSAAPTPGQDSGSYFTDTAPPYHLGQQQRQQQRPESDSLLRSFVRDIVLIFISHAHADHHLGLLSLLTLRHAYRETATTARHEKLLVVCPTEVYRFLMDAWGSTEPYRTWLHAECVFDLMPPPLRAVVEDEEGAVRDHDGDDGDHDGEQQHSQHAAMERVDAVPPLGEKLAVPQNPPSHRCGHTPSFHTGAAVQQRVVATPLLTAQLARWNACIAAHAPPIPQSSPSPPPLRGGGENTGNEERVGRDDAESPMASQPQCWDAEVITVDHPANAHALLLRFPHCSAHSLAMVSGSSEGGTAASSPPHAPPRASAEEDSRVAEKSGNVYALHGPCAAAPDTSRVFVFSGDTRPSSFLVERSRAFTTPSPHRCAAATTQATSPVFILLHEATFGPGFEGEAVRKKHSTLPEALDVGAAVEAEFIVLNHFSQRYPKLPGLSEEQLGGRSTELVCQRRPRATAAAAAGSAEQPQAAAPPSSPSCAAPESLLERTESALPTTADAVTSADGGDDNDEHSPPSSVSPSSPYANMSFAFDLMSVSFSAMHHGLVPRLTPALVRLLEEYDSWGVSTTHRMRTARQGNSKK